MLNSTQGFVEAPPAPPVAEIQLVPHSIEAEQALLGALLLDPDQMLECSYLGKSDFYLLNNGILFDAMKTLFERHNGYDPVTVAESLRSAGNLDDVGGQIGLYDLINVTPTSIGAPEYAAIIYQHSIARQTINAAAKIAQSAYRQDARTPASLVNEAIDELANIDATRNISSGPQSINAGVDDLLEMMQEIENNQGVAGLPSGIKTLDNILGGLQKESLYLLAGRPGMGKSGLAIQIAYNVAKRGIPVLFFALEMSRRAIAARLVSLVCGVQYESFNRPGVQSWGKVIDAVDKVSKLPIIIDTTPDLTASQIRAITQKEMIKSPIGLVIIDHGGIVSPEKQTGNEYQDASQVALRMKNLPKQLGIPILCLVQLSRKVEENADKRPKMHHLRETGKWEENADGIMFLYRDEVYNPDTEFPGLGELIIEKNRGGKPGIITMAANVGLNRYTDLETRQL